MTREQAKDAIRKEWRTLLPSFTGIAKAPVNGERSYICPICGHGSNGDGLTFDPKSVDHNTLKCFGCGRSGDVMDFYQEAKNVDFNTALKDLSQQLGLELEKEQPQPSFTGSRRKHDPKTKRGADFLLACREALHNSPEGLDYLKSRGLSLETAERFGLGYDPAWFSPEAEEKGKFCPETKRLIIPAGETFYLARAIEPLKGYEKQNEGRTQVFNLSALYDDTEGPVFVCEGAIDALSIIEAGGNAIALNGAGNIDLLKAALEAQTTKKTLLISFDNDKAGKEGAERLRKELKRLNVSFLTVQGLYPEGCKDANEALIKHPAEFSAAVERNKGKASARPDNVLTYIDGQMVNDLTEFKKGLGVKTGLAAIDNNSKGLFSGLYILAAIPSLGKTTLACQMADNLAMSGHEVIFFSLEQSALEMVSKSLARITAQHNLNKAVTSLSIRCGQFPPQVEEAHDEYREKVGNRLSIIEGNFNCNVSYIAEYVRKYIRDTGTRPIVFIDYVQILEPPAEDMGHGTKEAVDSVITTLKRLSRELNITIIAISSVNRSSYLVPISFESLKETGGLEFTADVVWGLQLSCLTTDPEFLKEENRIKKREIVNEAKAANPREIELICLKNRFGKASYSGSFLYYPAHDLFIDHEREEETAFSFSSRRRG